MCGICGVYNKEGRIPARGELQIMTQRLTHRGPDDEGYYSAPGIGLGHRRLSILDLKSGHQPLHSEDNTIWLVVNGEIYNFVELRQRLEQQGHSFSTRTDVEVIPHLYEEHGEDFVSYLRGMFSLALWDSTQEKLILARDRAGEKPLCYWEGHGGIVFASELQALMAWPQIPRALDRDALDMYLGLQYVPAPWTMLQGVRKLEPGHMLVVQRGTVRIRQYWRLTVAFQQRLRLNEYEQGIREHLAEAVRMRMASDVPMGVLLSGGIDSSAVLSYAAAVQPGIQTFSIGFAEAAYNELPFARQAAAASGSTHHEYIVTPHVADIIPALVRHYGEPFADSSAIPTFYLAQFVSGRAKVVLSGDGGDELFGGYDRYRAWHYSRLMDHLPKGLRLLLGKSMGRFSAAGDVHSLGSRLQRFVRAGELPAVERYLSWIAAFSPAERQLLYKQPLPGASRDLGVLMQRWPTELAVRQGGGELLEIDRALYLPDDLLVKVDIASMASGVEVRAVFLDHIFMEYAAAIPFDLKVRLNQGKYILRRALRERLPRAIVHRKKRGFGVPLFAWLRGPLFPFVEESLCGSRARQRPFFQQEYIQRLLREQQRGIDHSYKLWSLLMLEWWCREFLD